MKLPFHLVIEYARTKPLVFEQALREFFEDYEALSENQEEQAFPLFSEWVIYDFRQPSRTSFLAEYCLKNPDSLSELEISRMQEVTQTQLYGMFEIQEVKRGQWLRLEELFKGKIYQVNDNTSSQTIPKFGTLYARIGKVEDKWYFVGSNPIYLSTTYTPRMKKIMHKDFSGSFCSPKDTWQLIDKPKDNPPPPVLSLAEIQQKRKEIKITYQDLSKKHNFNLPFAEIIIMVYEENNTSPLDIWKKYVDKGLPEEVLVSHTQLFENIWNYFPHKTLNGKSPIEMVQEFRRAKKG